MATDTKIEWVRNSDGTKGMTFNPWIGCTKVSPGCDHCYAEALVKRGGVSFGNTQWGSGHPRYRTKGPWRDVAKFNARCAAAGIRGRVFCASLADVWDNEVDPAWRADLFAVWRQCQALDFLALSKRIGNAAKMLPADWGDGYANVWLGATVVNQAEAIRDVPKLLATTAVRRFLSIEPMLGPVDLRKWTLSVEDSGGVTPWGAGIDVVRSTGAIDWVICGGESGPGARPMHPEWARDLRDQCAEAGVPFFFKQWGEWAPDCRCENTKPCATTPRPGPVRMGVMWRCGKHRAGRLLDGREHNDMPAASNPPQHAATKE